MYSAATPPAPSDSDTASIRLEGVSKTYTKADNTLHALKDINLTLAAGDSVALVGPSGAGKSTLLNLMGLMDVPSSGEVRMFGARPFGLSEKERSKLRGKNIGFIFQSFNLIPQLSALANVALPLKYGGISRGEREERSMTMLERVGLAEWAGHYPSELSGGQEQRVAIARALVTRPQLILADEPTGNLDSETRDKVLALIQDVRPRDSVLVLVTHDPQVASYAQRQVLLKDGAIVTDLGL